MGRGTTNTSSTVTLPRYHCAPGVTYPSITYLPTCLLYRRHQRSPCLHTHLLTTSHSIKSCARGESAQSNPPPPCLGKPSPAQPASQPTGTQPPRPENQSIIHSPLGILRGGPYVHGNGARELNLLGGRRGRGGEGSLLMPCDPLTETSKKAPHPK